MWELYQQLLRDASAEGGAGNDPPAEPGQDQKPAGVRPRHDRSAMMDRMAEKANPGGASNEDDDNDDDEDSGDDEFGEDPQLMIDSLTAEQQELKDTIDAAIKAGFDPETKQFNPRKPDVKPTRRPKTLDEFIASFPGAKNYKRENLEMMWEMSHAIAGNLVDEKTGQVKTEVTNQFNQTMNAKELHAVQGKVEKKFAEFIDANEEHLLYHDKSGKKVMYQAKTPSGKVVSLPYQIGLDGKRARPGMGIIDLAREHADKAGVWSRDPEYHLELIQDRLKLMLSDKAIDLVVQKTTRTSDSKADAKRLMKPVKSGGSDIDSAPVGRMKKRKQEIVKSTAVHDKQRQFFNNFERGGRK